MGWWPEDQRQRMWRGDGCSMCADAGLPRNEFSDLIAETTTSFVRLSHNQTQAGYSVVIAKRHVPELHHLTPDEREGFWSDVSAVGEATSTLFRPVKLAQLAMGFRMPHFNCHVYPQFLDDDPLRLLDPQHGAVRLDPADWDERVRLVRREFMAARP